jgi:PAS domain S-box-containing protein
LAGQPSFLARRTHPEDNERVLTAVEQARRTSSLFSVEYRLQSGSDRWLWFQDEAVLVRDPQGRPLHWQGVLVDVTARKTAEDALRHSEERFRALVHNGYDIVVVLDSAGTRKCFSPSIERLLGHVPADLLGRSPDDIVHPDDLPVLAEAIESCLRGVKETPAFELRLRHRSSSQITREERRAGLLVQGDSDRAISSSLPGQCLGVFEVGTTIGEVTQQACLVPRANESPSPGMCLGGDCRLPEKPREPGQPLFQVPRIVPEEIQGRAQAQTHSG